jgi:hypothetical protein
VTAARGYDIVTSRDGDVTVRGSLRDKPRFPAFYRSSMRTFLLVTTMLLSPAADAERPRYAREQHLDLDVTLSSRVRPKATPRVAAPVVTADDMMLIEERTQPIRREQEVILTKLIADTPDSDADKPEYMFRLAEHYAKQLRFWRLKAAERAITRGD